MGHPMNAKIRMAKNMRVTLVQCTGLGIPIPGIPISADP